MIVEPGAESRKLLFKRSHAEDGIPVEYQPVYGDKNSLVAYLPIDKILNALGRKPSNSEYTVVPENELFRDAESLGNILATDGALDSILIEYYESNFEAVNGIMGLMYDKSSKTVDLSMRTN